MDILISIIYGIVEGITEWLPVSSTGHMILLNSLLKFQDTSDGFYSMYEVVIQLGAILAVVVLFWKRLWPFGIHEGHPAVKKRAMRMWGQIIIACLPAAIVGVLFDDKFEALFYNPTSVALALIIVGVAFIVVENYEKNMEPTITRIRDFTWKTALIIGLFQVIAAIFPGTSRSGATIIGALLIGVSRTCAAEFTFFLAVPVMLGASLLKVVKFGAVFTGHEVAVLLVGCITAFVVSLFIIKFLMNFVKTHDFKVFGWYRIALGAFVLIAGATFLK